MRTQGIKNGVIAIRCTESTIADWLNTVPPLGTADEDGNPTSEISADTCIAGTYKESQAVLGLFEQLYGKLGLSVTIDEDQTDSMDLTTGRSKTKGYQNVEGNFELEMLNEDGRWDGAAQGNWDYLARGYYPRKVNREYEMWILMGPDVKTLYAATAERLWKFYGLTLGRVEYETGQPNKFRVPFHARMMIPFPKWVEASPIELRASAVIADDTSYSLDTPITYPKLFQTRLKFTFTDLHVTAPTRSLVIRGYNIFGEQVVEDVDASAWLATEEYITKQHFSSVNPSGVTMVGEWFVATTTMVIDEYDVALVPV